MAATVYTGVNYRTVQADHVAAEMPSKGKLFGAGAVRIDPNPPFRSQGGSTFEVPHWLELSTADAAPTAATDATLGAISDFKDIGVICQRQLPVGVERSVLLALGDQPIGDEILSQVPGYWSKRMQVALYSVLKGAFASAMSGAEFVKDLGVPMTSVSVADIIGLSCIGDQWEEFKIWVVSPTQFGQLTDAGLTTYVNAGAFGERALQTGVVPTFLGKQIVMDGQIQETDGSTYLLKPNGLYLGFQSDPGVEYERKATLAGGTDAYMFQAAFMPHLFGLNYAGAAKPTNTTLATGASWTLSQTTDYQLHKAVKIKFANT